MLIGGCGSGASVDPGADRPAFDKAVADYLDAQNMGLKIDAYKQFSMSSDGKTASAEIAMADAGGVMSATARFTFQFEKSGSGWRVRSHQQK